MTSGTTTEFVYRRISTAHIPAANMFVYPTDYGNYKMVNLSKIAKRASFHDRPHATRFDAGTIDGSIYVARSLCAAAS